MFKTAFIAIILCLTLAAPASALLMTGRDIYPDPDRSGPSVEGNSGETDHCKRGEGKGRKGGSDC